MPLNSQQVHHARTSGERDCDLAVRWGVRVAAVRLARRGETWADHTTPPDTKPRAHKGNWASLNEAEVSP
jgi:hypothetical protein